MTIRRFRMCGSTLRLLFAATVCQLPMSHLGAQAIKAVANDSVLRLRCEAIQDTQPRELVLTGLTIRRFTLRHPIVAELTSRVFSYQREDGKPYNDGAQIVRMQERVLWLGGPRGVELSWASDAVGPGAVLNTLALESGLLTRVELVTELAGSTQAPKPPFTDAVNTSQYKCSQVIR